MNLVGHVFRDELDALLHGDRRVQGGDASRMGGPDRHGVQVDGALIFDVLLRQEDVPDQVVVLRARLFEAPRGLQVVDAGGLNLARRLPRPCPTRRRVSIATRFHKSPRRSAATRFAILISTRFTDISGF
jgi:hypothetical protein